MFTQFLTDTRTCPKKNAAVSICEWFDSLSLSLSLSLSHTHTHTHTHTHKHLLTLARFPVCVCVCVCTGCVLASEFLDLKLTRNQILDAALIVENHPDNLSAAIWGKGTVRLEDFCFFYTHKTTNTRAHAHTQTHTHTYVCICI
jgi:hypothetical protein